MASLLCLRPRPFSLSRRAHPELLKFYVVLLQCLLVCMLPQSWVGHIHLLIMFLSFCHMIGTRLRMQR